MEQTVLIQTEHRLAPFSFSSLLAHEVSLVWRDDTFWEFVWDWSALLQDSIDKEHGHDVFLVVKVPIPVNVTEIPDLAELVSVQARLDEDIACRLGVQESSSWSKGLKVLDEACGRILQSPAIEKKEMMKE